jgi:hypothetical protein
MQDLLIFVRHVKPDNGKVQKRCNPCGRMQGSHKEPWLKPTHEALSFLNKHVPRRQKCSNKQKLHSCASECQAHAQLADFLDSENHNWIVAYCKFLPQTEGQWRALADEGTCPQDPTIQEARLTFAGDESVLQTQKTALRHLVNHCPCLDRMLMQHVNATVSDESVRQLDVLPRSIHASACNSLLKTLPSGRRNLKLDIISVASLRLASTVLPQMQGLNSLQLIVRHADAL